MVLFRTGRSYGMAKVASIFFLIFVFVCYAQPKEKVVSFDFGEVSSKKVLSHRFVFEEKIVSVISLCECLKIDISKEKDKFMVDIKLDPYGYEGKISLEGLLIKEDGNIIRLRIFATVGKE